MILLWLQIFIKKIQFLLHFQSIKSDLLGYLGGRSVLMRKMRKQWTFTWTGIRDHSDPSPTGWNLHKNF